MRGQCQESCCIDNGKQETDGETDHSRAKLDRRYIRPVISQPGLQPPITRERGHVVASRDLPLKIEGRSIELQLLASGGVGLEGRFTSKVPRVLCTRVDQMASRVLRLSFPSSRIARQRRRACRAIQQCYNGTLICCKWAHLPLVQRPHSLTSGHLHSMGSASPLASWPHQSPGKLL